MNMLVVLAAMVQAVAFEGELDGEMLDNDDGNIDVHGDKEAHKARYR